MPLQQNYIFAFLHRDHLEGPQALHGYIPCHKVAGGTANYRGIGDPAAFIAMGASGVTFATGVDLGQTDITTLTNYGLDAGIINFVYPYLGLKKQAALQKLHALPLTVSQDIANQVDRAVHAGYLHRYVIPAYDKAAQKPFANLPKQAQAVIFSLCFQKGCTGVRKDWPKVWNHLIQQDWPSAAKELLHGFSQYASRRAVEGRELMELC